MQMYCCALCAIQSWFLCRSKVVFSARHCWPSDSVIKNYFCLFPLLNNAKDHLKMQNMWCKLTCICTTLTVLWIFSHILRIFHLSIILATAKGLAMTVSCSFLMRKVAENGYAAKCSQELSHECHLLPVCTFIAHLSVAISNLD